MNTTMKRIALFTLSACLMAGCAVSGFAAGGSAYTVLGRQTNDCGGTQKAEIVVRYTGGDGAARDYVICAECGDVNGAGCLDKVEGATANLSELYVYTGTLDNGERVMTVSCLTSGYSAMSRVAADVWLPADVVEGYDLYCVNADGTETRLDVSAGGSTAHFRVSMEDGAALIRMVER